MSVMKVSSQPAVVADFMQRDVETVSPGDTLRDAARLNDRESRHGIASYGRQFPLRRTDYVQRHS